MEEEATSRSGGGGGVAASKTGAGQAKDKSKKMRKEEEEASGGSGGGGAAEKVSPTRSREAKRARLLPEEENELKSTLRSMPRKLASYFVERLEGVEQTVGLAYLKVLERFDKRYARVARAVTLEKALQAEVDPDMRELLREVVHVKRAEEATRQAEEEAARQVRAAQLAQAKVMPKGGKGSRAALPTVDGDDMDVVSLSPCGTRCMCPWNGASKVGVIMEFNNTLHNRSSRV